jgi:hypothetical protein
MGTGRPVARNPQHLWTEGGEDDPILRHTTLFETSEVVVDLLERGLVLGRHLRMSDPHPEHESAGVPLLDPVV